MTEFGTPIQAGSYASYETDILSGGVAVLLAQIQDIKLTLVDGAENIINLRDQMSIKNTNGGVVTDGHLVLTLNADDTAQQSADPSQVQTRYLHFDITLVGGAVCVHEVLWYVQDNHVPGDD